MALTCEDDPCRKSGNDQKIRSEVQPLAFEQGTSSKEERFLKKLCYCFFSTCNQSGSVRSFLMDGYSGVSTLFAFFCSIQFSTHTLLFAAPSGRQRAQP